MNNIPANFNEDGEYWGNLPEEEHFVKVSFTPEELDLVDRSLTEYMIQVGLEPMSEQDHLEFGSILEVCEKIRLAKQEAEK